MQTLRNRPPLRRSGVLWLRAEDIEPNPVQPRRRFDDLLANRSEIHAILKRGAERARDEAAPRMAEIRRLVGTDIYSA